jgi:hypothetical protein
MLHQTQLCALAPYWRRGAADRETSCLTVAQPRRGQNYGLALLLIGAVPILPVIIELAIHKAIIEDSLAITAAVYSTEYFWSPCC